MHLRCASTAIAACRFMVIVLAGLLASACQGKRVDYLDIVTLKRSGLTALDTDELAGQRMMSRKEFADRMGSGFRIVDSRDYLMSANSSLAQVFHEFPKGFRLLPDTIAPRCRSGVRAMEVAAATMEVRAELIEGNCRYLVFYFREEPFDNTERRLVSMYDVEELTPARKD